MAAAQGIHGGVDTRRRAGLAECLAVLLTFAVAVPCEADVPPVSRVPAAGDTTTRDAQSYSYYYVPHLSELNQLVGYLFRSGLVRKDAPGRDSAITRYAAYSCEGTLYVGGGPGQGAAEDVNWSLVTGLHTGPVAGPPSLVIERRPSADAAGRPLVLYVPDSSVRYQLHQALAVLVSECRARPERGGTSLRGH